MKLLFICAITLLVSYSLSAPSCAASGYCMGCSDTTANSCTSCFNWGSGSVKARALISNACGTQITTARQIADCEFYNGTDSNTNTRTIGSCTKCKKDFRNYVETSNTPTCSNTAILTSTCPKISNCLNTNCYDGTTDSTGCQLCKKNYSATTLVNASVGGSSCSSTMAITNCEYSYLTTAGASCYSCKANYAVDSATTACASYTTDKNCRQLHSGNTNCSQCWHSYYWNTSTCKLSAKIIAGVVSAMAVLMLQM